MPKLLRILVPLVVLGAVLAIPTTASAQANTTCGAGGWAITDPESPNFFPGCATWENYEWKSSVVRSNTATQSDFAFTSRRIDGVRHDYVVAGNYAGFRIFDVTDPTDPILKSDTPCGGSQGDITMVGNLIFRSSDGSHNVPFADLNRACETSGNENQRVTLEGFDANGDSFQLRLSGNDTPPIVRGSNFTTAGIATALAGANEQQQVALTGFTVNGRSFTLSWGGETTDAIVRGQNYTQAGVANAVRGGNEQQVVTLASFDGTVKQSFRVEIGGEQSALLGAGGLPITNQNVADAINAITGFAGTVTVTGAGNTGFTVNYGGASAQTDVPSLSIIGCTAPCAATVRESAKGSTGLPNWPADATFTVTTNPNQGTIDLPNGGFVFTVAGSLGLTDIDPFTLNPGASVGGSVNETVKGTAPMPGWQEGGTVTVSALSDAGFNVTFTGAHAGADLPLLEVVNGTGDTTGTVAEQAKGMPGAGFVGMYIFDASDLENPTFLKAVPVCGGGHTHTVYDDKARNRVVVYMTRSTTTGSLPAFGVNCAGLPSNRLTAVTVPKSNPKAARIASENIVYPGSGGCHDTNVFEEKKRILTACLGSGVSMLDISDPLNATTVWGPFTWPNHGTWHTGSWSWSGDYVYVNGEPGGGSSSECAFDDHPAKPSVFALNADTGSLEGTWTLPRPQETTSANSNCTVHNLNVLPLANKNVLAHSFYTAGASLIDFTNPKAPREVAFIDQILTPGGGGVIGSGSGCWSAYWYNGTIFCNELSWGLHLFGINEENLPWYADTMTLDAHNAQTVTNFIRCEVSFRGGPARAGRTGTVTATAKLYGPAPLQAAKATNVRISGPGFNRLVTTNQNGVAQATVKATRRGAINVAVREADNLNITGGCSAPSKAVAKKRAVR